MSNLVRAVKALATDKRFANTSQLFDQVVDIKSESTQPIIPAYRQVWEYKITATFGSKVKVFIEESNPPVAINAAISNTKQSIIQAVFGEFRDDFRLVQKALWERDIEKAVTLLNAFEKKMFTDE